MRHVSDLRLYSYGIIAENKERGTPYVEIVPMEILPSTEGKVTKDREDYTVEGEDRFGTQYKVKCELSKTIPAKWMPWGTNRKTVPDVRIGERVSIWQFADDVEEYYWECLGMDDHLRKLETVIFAISGTKDEADTTLRKDNTYYMEFSSHDKHITLSTSAKNNEKFRYEFKIDTEDDKLHLKDDVGNIILLDSANTLIKLKNKAGAKFELNKKDIKSFAPGFAIHESEKLMKLIAPEMDLGEASKLEPQVLGDKLADYIADLEKQLNAHTHKSPETGADTSPPTKPFDLSDGKKGGRVYSKVNRNQ